MYDFFATTAIWIISLSFAFLSARQSKGVDWYAPITKKTMMNWTMVNIAIITYLFVVFSAIITNLVYRMIALTCFCSIVIACLARLPFKKWFGKILTLFRENVTRDGDGNKLLVVSDNKAVIGDNSVGTSESTLKDMFAKILTTFNIVFCIVNVIYLFLVCYFYNKDILEIDLAEFIEITKGKVFNAHAVILFWTSASGAFLTSKKWQYADGYKQTRSYNAEYFKARICDRNRKVL